MLRPATPLTILLLAAFVLLLISVISTPIVKSIPLASFGGVDFGVFGVCQGNNCSDIEIGYNTVNLFTSSQENTFDLPSGTRATLSAILIVHPIAALFTLIMLILSAVAHFHSPSHSPRYLLGIFILSILTLTISLLAFLIDVLLFVPHMAWGSYIVLAATVLIAASGIVSCAMRRTLVSRKARKRRIAENAEMNGENFYNRQAGVEPVPLMTTANNNMVNGAPGVDKLPTFATFETGRKDPDERSSEERMPLTTRSPTADASPVNGPVIPGPGMPDRYGAQPTMGGNNAPRDQYGNVVPRQSPGPYGMQSRDPSLNRQYSDGATNGQGRGMPPGGFRGRGGYLPNGRGGYGPPRGGFGPRGGYGPPPRGGYGGMNDAMASGAVMAAGGMRGGRAPPPGYGPPPNGRGYDNRGMSPASYGRRPSEPQQFANDAYAPPLPANSQYTPYNPEEPSRDSLPRAESPPPMPGLEDAGLVGQAVEMDATTGSPSRAPNGFGQFGNLRDSDGDVAGMIGLQQQKLHRQTMDTEPSRYSTDQSYVPPRQQWVEPGRSSPLNPASQPAELPSPITAAPRRGGSISDNYYEDVDPRFADPSITAPPPNLAPGYGQSNGSNQNLRPRPLQPMGLDGSASYEDLQSGARSPAESDRSNFTSVSQRGVNPRWNGGGYGAVPMPRRPVPQQNDILLNSNPDFMLPGGRGGRGFPRGGRGGTGTVPSSAYPA